MSEVNFLKVVLIIILYLLSRGKSVRVRSIRLRVALAFLLLAIIMCGVALARDPDGRWKDSPLKPWFDTLTNQGREPCCSDSDGLQLAVSEWETQRDKPGFPYRVRLPTNLDAPRSSEKEWVDVPEDSVVVRENLAHVPIAWPMHKDGRVVVRCFLPGDLS